MAKAFLIGAALAFAFRIVIVPQLVLSGRVGCGIRFTMLKLALSPVLRSSPRTNGGCWLCRTYLWDGSEMLDLNALVRAGSNPEQLFLLLGFGINDSEEIAGWGLTGGGDIHALLAKPIRGRSGDRTTTAEGRRPTVVTFDHGRKMIRRALRSR